MRPFDFQRSGPSLELALELLLDRLLDDDPLLLSCFRFFFFFLSLCLWPFFSLEEDFFLDADSWDDILTSSNCKASTASAMFFMVSAPSGELPAGPSAPPAPAAPAPPGNTAPAGPTPGSPAAGGAIMSGATAPPAAIGPGKACISPTPPGTKTA